MKPDSASSEKSTSAPAQLIDRPDRELINAWKRGDQHAADVLWRRYTTRLIGLVASRIAEPFRDSIAPDDVVQSAWGSFFRAAKQSRVQVSETLGLWQLLAVFAQRKLARRFEASAAAKRGGHAITRLPQEAIQAAVCHDTANAVELQEWIESELDAEHRTVLVRLLAGYTQRQVAKELSIDERTVRRRLKRLRQQFCEEESSASPPPEPNLPRHLPNINYGQFVLAGLVGSGAFGKVYRAHLQATGEQVAVKFLRKAFWQPGMVRATFLREIDLASQVHHPSILRYRGWGLSPHGGPYIVSDWIDGVTLAQTSGFHRSSIIDSLSQLADALRAIHSAGLVHGDLTPSNIMRKQDGRLVVTDFGMACTTDAAQQTADTQPHVGGTPGFAAPEQLSSAFGSIGPWTDIYALGGLAYWFANAQAPHDGSALVDRVAATLATEKRSETASHWLSDFIEACLQPSPSERCVDIGKLQTLLNQR